MSKKTVSEELLNKAENYLKNIIKDFESGAELIYKEKIDLWIKKFMSLKSRAEKLKLSETDRKKRKELEEEKFKICWDLIAFKKSIEIMRMLSQNPKTIKDEIDKMNLAPEVKKRALKNVLFFAQGGPSFYEAIHGGILCESDAFAVNEIKSINEEIDKGLSYSAALSKVTKARTIKITDNAALKMEGTIIVNQDENCSITGICKMGDLDGYLKGFSSQVVLTTVGKDPIRTQGIHLDLYGSNDAKIAECIISEKGFEMIDKGGCHQVEVIIEPIPFFNPIRQAELNAKYNCLISGTTYNGSQAQHAIQKRIKQQNEFKKRQL